MKTGKIIAKYEIYDNGIAIGRTTNAKLIKTVKDYCKDTPDLFVENNDEFMFAIPSDWLDVEELMEEELFEREHKYEYETCIK